PSRAHRDHRLRSSVCRDRACRDGGTDGRRRADLVPPRRRDRVLFPQRCRRKGTFGRSARLALSPRSFLAVRRPGRTAPLTPTHLARDTSMTTPIDRLSFQLYSARSIEPLEAQFKLLAGLGYRMVEPWGGLFNDTETLKRLLQHYGMTAPSAHVGLDRLRTDAAGTAK